MSKLFAISLSILILFQSSNIHFDDILKLREIIEYAALHKKKYEDSVVVFLSKHYGSLKEAHQKQHQEEKENHPHPPIHHDCSTQIATIFVLSTHLFLLKHPIPIEKSTNFHYQDKFSTFEKQRVFQPPQIV